MTDKVKSVGDTAVNVVKHDDGSVDLREAPGGQALEFTASEWTAFMKGVKAGQFDLPPEHGGQQ